MTLPINHLRKTLDRCCGQWEFDSLHLEEACFVVRFLNTGKVFRAIVADEDGAWLSQELIDGRWETSNYLSARLNGLTRDDAGSVSGDPIYETPDKVVQ